MRISLSNGESFVLAKYEKAVVNYKGDKTNALILYLENTTLDAVKAAFSNEDNLNTVYIYSDTNERFDYNGYQTRKSIAVGDGDESFEVTLVKATDLSLKVDAMIKDVEAMTQVFNQAITAFTDMQQASIEYASAAREAINKAASAEATSTDAVKHAEELATSLRSAYGTVESFTNELTYVKNYFEQVLGESRQRAAEYTRIISAIREIQSNTSGINDIATKMETAFNAKVSAMDSVISEVRTIRTNVDTTMTSVGNTEKHVEKFASDIETFSNTVKTATSTASEAESKANEAKKVTDNLGERLAALEPVTDISKMSLDEARIYRIKESQLALSEWLQNNYAYFTHNGKMNRYSITSEKQGWLQAMIITATMAESKGINYQPSWNASGEPCTYDWTAEELQQLAMVIESIVRPRISGQQRYEKEILAANTIEELALIEFDYDSCSGELYHPSISGDPSTNQENGADTDKNGEDLSDQPLNGVPDDSDSSQTES